MVEVGQVWRDKRHKRPYKVMVVTDSHVYIRSLTTVFETSYLYETFIRRFEEAKK